MNDYIAFSAYFGAALTLIIYVVSFRISDRIGHPLPIRSSSVWRCSSGRCLFLILTTTPTTKAPGTSPTC